MRVLAGIDFSELTEPVCRVAAELCRRYDAELVLVHVAAPDPDFVGFEAGPQVVRVQRADELRTEHRELEALAADLRGRGVRADARLVAGPAVDTLLDLARRTGVEMIVLGSHGHGALASALLGSVSVGVLRRAPCPVLIVPRSSVPAK